MGGAPGQEVQVASVETVAELLLALESGAPRSAFYDRLCNAVCRTAALDRAVIFVYDGARRRVRAVGSHGIPLELFADQDISVEEAPIAQRALHEDAVVEVTGDYARWLPSWSERFLVDTRLVVAPIAAAGRPFGVVLADRSPENPLSDAEKHTLWTLGKIAALAAAARHSTREQDRARELEERMDLAREVHDRVIQRLFGVSLALAGEGPLGAPERTRAREELEKAVADLRIAVRRPLGARSVATVTTLHAEVARLARAHPDLGVRLAEGGQAPVPAHLEAVAQSVLAEAIRNAHKHARPTEVVVAIDHDGAAFRLDVVNDGLEAGRRRAPDGIGLRLAALEALHVGGTVVAGRREPGRWGVRLVVPEDGG